MEPAAGGRPSPRRSGRSATCRRPKSTDTRKGLKEHFEEPEKQRLLDALQTAVNVVAIGRAFIPGFGLVISAGIEFPP